MRDAHGMFKQYVGIPFEDFRGKDGRRRIQSGRDSFPGKCPQF